MTDATLWKNFLLETTGDRSPTLRLKSGERPESMHHNGGAASETIYIYGSALQRAFNRSIQSGLKTLHTCSVGLGLAYNEILIGLLLETTPAYRNIKCTVESYEIDQEIRDAYFRWMQNVFDPQTVVFDMVIESLKKQMNLNLDVVRFKEKMNSQYQNKNWIVLQDLSTKALESQLTSNKANICLFDAFSKKTSNELWSPEFLDFFIQKKFNNEYCLFVTYACTGVLNRSLKKNNFKVEKKDGFNGKRHSTIAERGPQDLSSVLF